MAERGVDAAGVVVVGGGLAGAKTVEALRDAGYDGRLVLVGAEPHRPYHRPPLSKKHLTGSVPDSELFVLDADWYAGHDVDLRTSTEVVELDRGAHEVVGAGGERLPYEALVLATGSEPRRLQVPGADASGVLYLRTLDDNAELRTALQPGRRVVVVGGGWIGLEVAAAARTAGAEVTLLEAGPLPLGRVLGPRLAPVFADLHREHQVDVRTGVQVSELRTRGSGSVAAVELGDGTLLEADAVVVGVGVTPRTALAERSGLAVDDGVLVDAQLRSADPDVYAVGDLARAEHPFLGRRLRVEHWANALNQPAVAARALLGGPDTYDRLPYFFTDQYDLGMEYVGDVPPGAEPRVVVRGDLGARELVAFWLDDGGRVLAGMNVNVWDVVEPVRRLILSRTAVDPAALADPDVPLESLT